VQGVWLVEIAEMAGMAKAEVETIKHFVSKTEDRFRVAYGVRTENFPRQCIFVATTNKTDFLKDPTGNRRFWPVQIHAQQPTKDVFKDLTEEEINQIWAEAVVRYKDGEQLHLSEEMVELATEAQTKHTQQHPWVGLIENYLSRKLPLNWTKMSKSERQFWLGDNEGDEVESSLVMYRDRVCMAELWAEALGKRDVIDERSAVTIRNIMGSFDEWKEDNIQRRYGVYGRFRNGYVRKTMLNNYEVDEFEAAQQEAQVVTKPVTDFDLF